MNKSATSSSSSSLATAGGSNGGLMKHHHQQPTTIGTLPPPPSAQQHLLPSSSLSSGSSSLVHQAMTHNGLIPFPSSSSIIGGVPLGTGGGGIIGGSSSSLNLLKKQQPQQPIKILGAGTNSQQQQSSSEPSWRDEINREKRKELFSLASRIANISSEDNKTFLDLIVESWKKASSREDFSNSIAKSIVTNYKPTTLPSPPTSTTTSTTTNNLYTFENIQKEILDCINTKSTSASGSTTTSSSATATTTSIGTSNIVSNQQQQQQQQLYIEDFTTSYWKVYEQLKKHSDFIKTEVLTPLQKRFEEGKLKLDKFPKGSHEYEKLSMECTKQFENAKHLDFLLALFNAPSEKRTNFKPNESHMKFISSLKEGLKKKYKIQFDQDDFDILKMEERDLQIGIETLNESLGFSYLLSTASFVGDFNCFNLESSLPTTTTHSNGRKKKCCEDASLNLNLKKKKLSMIEIIKRSLINEVKMDELPSLTFNIVDPPLIKVEKQSETVYTVIFIVHPKEKGTITLPNLNIDVLVEDLNILPCSITFKNNYATEKNSLFVNIRRYFSNLIGSHALFGIGSGGGSIGGSGSVSSGSRNSSTDNIPFQNLHSSITLPQILNSWIQSIIHIIKNELLL